jgi:tetratricopeptide (TPR) repeat protein
MRKLHEIAGLGPQGRISVIHGLPGIGKTSLAIQYAHTYSDFYSGGRWFIRCAGKSDLVLALSVLRSFFFCSWEESNDPDKTYHILMILRNLEQYGLTEVQQQGMASNPKSSTERKRVLLILDNVESWRLLSPPQTDCLSTNSWLHVLASTQLDQISIRYNEHLHTLLNVDELSHDACMSLLESSQTNRQFASAEEMTAAGELVRLLGNFTLAVEIVAAYLSERQGLVSCSGMLKRLQKEGFLGVNQLSQQATRIISHGEATIEETIMPLLDLLSAKQMAVLRNACYLPSDAIPILWLRYISGLDYPEFLEDSEPGYEDPWLSILNRLTGIRLLQIVERSSESNSSLMVRMSRLIQSCIKQRIDHSCQTRFLSRISSFFFDRISLHLNPGSISSLRWEVSSLVDLAEIWAEEPKCWSSAYLFSTSDNNILEIFHSKLISAGEFLMDRAGAPRLAEIFYNMATYHYSEYCLTCFSLHAECHFRLATLLYQRGSLPDCEQHLGNALGLFNNIDNPTSLIPLKCKHLLGKVLYSKDKYDDALRLHRQVALEASRLGIRDLLIDCYQSMASTCEVLQIPLEAFSYCEKALKLSIELYGAKHKRTGELLNILGQLYRNTKQKGDSIKLFEMSLEILELHLGSQHCETINAQNNLAQMYIDVDRIDEADVILERILDETLKIQGKMNPDYVAISGNYGIVNTIKGDIHTGLSLLKEGVEIAESIVSDRQTHADCLLAEAVYRYAIGLANAKLADSAAKQFNRSGNIWRACFGESDPRACKAFSMEAKYLSEMKDNH